MKIALTIGGSDPTSGAGIQVDLKTFHALGVYGVSLPSSLTAQSTGGVSDIYNVPDLFFKKQCDILLGDIQPDAVKTGMLGRKETVKVISEMLKKYSLKNLVIDPVAVSSTGVQLTQDDALQFMRDHLIPMARIITPNIHEASLITGVPVQNEQDMKNAAARLKDLGPETVIVTGGHLEEKTTDIFFDGKEFLLLQREKIAGEFHGSGCVFSSALTASLALGYDTREAAVNANDFVWKAIQSAVSIGKGMNILDI
jgi:hydroxymethylpyrimidine/phosphomethylpyrimidine kinase